MNIGKMVRSFRPAIAGLRGALRENNIRFQILAAAIVIGAGAWCRISRTDWLFLVMAMAMVFAAELINTALETALDRLHPTQHPEIGRAKDLAAAGVLVAAGAAVVVGILVFAPYMPGSR